MVGHEIVIRRDGSVVGIYSDAVPYRELAAALGGTLDTRRASHVEPDGEGRWIADLGPSSGPVFGPFNLRSEALAAEVAWLRQNVLGVPS